MLRLCSLPFDVGFSTDSLVLVDFPAKVDATFILYWKQNNIKDFTLLYEILVVDFESVITVIRQIQLYLYFSRF